MNVPAVDGAHRQRILVIDDDPDLLELIALLLSDCGYEVMTAGDGRAALDVVARAHPDLILLDMKMPVMNGWQFAAAYKEACDGEAPIVVLTASDDVRLRAREVGAQGWLGKPFRPEELLAVVARQLHR